MKEDLLFKKAAFGGFDRMEVISYVQHLKTAQQNYKLMLDEKEARISALGQEVEQLTARLDESKAELSQAKAEIAELEQKLENAQPDEEQYAEETVRMCDELVETATQTAEKLVSSAQEKLAKIVSELDGDKTFTQKQLKTKLNKLIKELK